MLLRAFWEGIRGIAEGALSGVCQQVKEYSFLEWNINEKSFSLSDAHICVLRHFLFKGYNFTFLAFERNTGHCRGSTDDFKTHILKLPILQSCIIAKHKIGCAIKKKLHKIRDCILFFTHIFRILQQQFQSDISKTTIKFQYIEKGEPDTSNSP